MLSRVAKRVYWMGRYMERVENTARLINANTNLLLDLPKGTRIGWLTLIDITGANNEFARKAIKNEEQAIMRFLISDTTSPISILSSLRLARENARTTREVLPTETWELINDLYLYVKENAARSLSRTARNKLLRQVVARAQQYTGQMTGIMSHTHAYDFIRLGRNLERADMTTRIVDVGTMNLITNNQQVETGGDSLPPYISILWMSVLQSLSAYQMYRQHVMDRINGEDVVLFLLQDPDFPRSVSSCLAQIKVCLNKLPNADDPLRAVGITQRRIDSADIADLLQSERLHEFIDEVQLDIGSIHDAIAQTWFLPVITANTTEEASA